MQALKGTIKLSELFALSEEDREIRMNEMVEAAFNPTEDQVQEQNDALSVRIVNFERRYEMSSVTMRKKLSQGAIKETSDICSWMLLVKARESFDPKSPQARPQ